MAQVELRGINKAFAGRPVVRDLDLTLERGELVSLLGPSGCGKTTTLRMVAGFEMPDSGAVSIDGTDLLQVPPHRRGMGVVFQHYALFPHLTAARNVAFGMRIAGRSAAEIRRRVPELLGLVGLAEAAGKYPRELSGGQQQRVALARALAIEPRMLLLDEPLSALDAVVRVALRDEIRRIQTSLGITTLYVTHDQEEALAISDRIVVMRDGRIEQAGTAEQIYAEPASRFVAGFIGKMNQIAGRIEDPARGAVACGPHRLAVPPAALASLAPGAPVIVLVRPEAVAIGPPGADRGASGNRLAAQVDGVSFLGSVRRVSLEASGQHLTADVAAVGGAALKRGDQVTLGFPAEACRVIVDEGGVAGGG
ncbi:MAG: ABC transporter ATP-binding protein [Dongiaceae bacterium]